MRCYPLTLLDGFSRYLLRCESLLDPDGIEVRRVLDSAFQEFGLPLAIRSGGHNVAGYAVCDGGMMIDMFCH